MERDKVERWIDLEGALAKLTDKQRVAVDLWMKGYTQVLMGEKLGISQQAAGGRVKRGLKLLRSML
jgi:DNA-directed RNA polymerase specialized sigma24 family protein